MTRIGVLVNPTAGKNTGARFGREAIRLLRASGCDILDLSAADISGALARGRAAIMAAAVDQIIVIGGDGMAHLGANMCAGTGVPLGIIAAGTGNDIARALGLPIRDSAAGVRQILAGSLRSVDLARHTTAHGERRWFMGVLAAGFDAVVNERANAWSWPRGRIRYNLAIIRELPVFTPIPYRLTLDGEVHSLQAMLVAVGNGPSYGGGMRVTPDARFDDGLLDVLVVSEISIPELLRVLPRVYDARHVDHPAVSIHRARTVRLDAPGIVSYADGERFAPLPMEVSAVGGALTVLA